MPHRFATQHVGRVAFAAASPLSAARWLATSSMRLDTGVHVHLANAYTLALADQDPAYRQALSRGALNFPDGKPIGVISRVRRDSPRLQQVRGPQLMLDTLRESERTEAKHYFLGSTTDVLAKLSENVREWYPNASIVGTESPPFRPLSETERREQIERIRASGAHIVWVGLGTPKQDLVARELAEVLPVAAVSVGAAFDYAAGTLKPAPDWTRKVGLEWAHRLAVEPRRLWRRYLFGNFRFLFSALRWGRRES